MSTKCLLYVSWMSPTPTPAPTPTPTPTPTTTTTTTTTTSYMTTKCLLYVH